MIFAPHSSAIFIVSSVEPPSTMITSLITPSSNAGIKEANVAGSSLPEFRVGMMIDSMGDKVSIVIGLGKGFWE